jgi:HD superfamily phosphohydrolase
VGQLSSKGKQVRDPIYGFITIHEDFLPIVDHELCQRLRWIGQLPLEQLVYPSAMHSRFEHSLGCMFLAMHAAGILIKDSRVLREAKKEFKSKSKDSFIYSAGLIGFLHDVGHAPFSHTLEEVKTYLGKPNFYDHEQVGYSVAEIVLPNNLPYRSTVLTVLNKNIKTFKSPVQKILRQLVDNHIDVDKGDYLLRDSYHCGVVYGQYDYRRLWDNITVTKNFDIALTEKNALEAWMLQLARYRMYDAVYKHHVRDFLDALLVKMIGTAYESDKKIIPVKNNKLTEEKLYDFLLWTDDNLIKTLYDNKKTKEQVLLFKKRTLYKRCCEDIQLNDYGISKNSLNDLTKQLREMEKRYEEKKIYTRFIFYKQNVLPLKTAGVTEMKVVCNGREEPLSKFLKFNFNGSETKHADAAEDMPDSELEQRILRIFVAESSTVLKKEIEEEYLKVLKQYKLP